MVSLEINILCTVYVLFYTYRIYSYFYYNFESNSIINRDGINLSPNETTYIHTNVINLKVILPICLTMSCLYCWFQQDWHGFTLIFKEEKDTTTPCRDNQYTHVKSCGQKLVWCKGSNKQINQLTVVITVAHGHLVLTIHSSLKLLHSEVKHWTSLFVQTSPLGIEEVCFPVYPKALISQQRLSQLFMTTRTDGSLRGMGVKHRQTSIFRACN